MLRGDRAALHHRPVVQSLSCDAAVLQRAQAAVHLIALILRDLAVLLEYDPGPATAGARAKRIYRQIHVIPGRLFRRKTGQPLGSAGRQYQTPFQ